MWSKLDFLVGGDATADERDVHAPEHEDGDDDADEEERNHEAVGVLAQQIDARGLAVCKRRRRQRRRRERALCAVVEAAQHEQRDVASNDDRDVEHRQRHEHKEVVVVSPLFWAPHKRQNDTDGGGVWSK